MNILIVKGLFNIIHETMHKNITENLIFKLNFFDTIITR